MSATRASLVSSRALRTTPGRFGSAIITLIVTDADKRMDGADVRVAAGRVPGEVRLRGVARDADQSSRAVKQAEATGGVEKVLSELAVPEDGR